MKDRYVTFKNYGEYEITEKKSRFIGIASPIDREDDAWSLLETVRKNHKEARHVVYAFQTDNLVRMSDDGEPSGTGGLPLLNILKANQTDNAILISVRYFGGILLGTGGLTRAYSLSGRKAAELAGLKEMILHRELLVEIDYNFLSSVTKAVNSPRNYSCGITDTQYTSKVLIKMPVELNFVQHCMDRLTEITNGTATFAPADTLYLEAM